VLFASRPVTLTPPVKKTEPYLAATSIASLVGGPGRGKKMTMLSDPLERGAVDEPGVEINLFCIQSRPHAAA